MKLDFFDKNFAVYMPTIFCVLGCIIYNFAPAPAIWFLCGGSALLWRDYRFEHAAIAMITIQKVEIDSLRQRIQIYQSEIEQQGEIYRKLVAAMAVKGSHKPND